jgi:hypothetical protein
LNLVESSIAQVLKKRIPEANDPPATPVFLAALPVPHRCDDYATFQDGALGRRRTRKAGKTLQMRSLQRLNGHLKIFLTLDLRD